MMYGAIAAAQKRGQVVALIDAGHAFTIDSAQSAGVDVQALLICQPENDEQSAEIVATLIKSGAVGVLVYSREK